METLVIHEAENAPITCDMTSAPDTPEERIAEYRRLFAHALILRERTPDAVVFTFAAKPGVAEWVADLARRESACCPFLSYEVAVAAEGVVWRTSSQAGPDAQAILDEFHGLPEQTPDGLPGMLQRLRGRGVETRMMSKPRGGCGC
jgi:hypothetical protein